MPDSKQLQSFKGKLGSLKQHAQLVDLSSTNANLICRNSSRSAPVKTISEVLGSNTLVHSNLNIPNQGKEIGRVFALSRSMTNEQVMVDVYRCFSEYLSSVIAHMSQRQPLIFQSILGGKKEHNLTFADIVKLGSYQAIISEMAKRVFRTLEEERSTKKLLNKLIRLTQIQVQNQILDECLHYLEIRHLIIHNSGKADAKFMNTNNHLGANAVVINTNRKIQFSFDLTQKAMDSIGRLCSIIDCELQRKNYL